MAIQKRKQSSIILAFKVLQFVNQLRRRVKPRMLDVPSKHLQPGTGLPRSHKGFNLISNELSRISVRDSKQARRVANRVCKSRKDHAQRSSPKVQTPVPDVSATPNVARDKMHQYVQASSLLVSSTKLGLACLLLSMTSSTLEAKLFLQLQAVTSSFSNTSMRPCSKLAP